MKKKGRTKKLWKLLVEAIKGTEVDYTKISLHKAIFLLAIPMILELVLESVFAVVDIFFVGKLGPSAVATVGLTETYLYLIYSVAMGLATAVTSIVARRIGEKNKQAAAVVAVQSVLLAMLASLPFAVGGIFYAKELLQLMGADQWVVQHGYKYTQWMLGGNAVIMFLFVLNAVFRGAGDAAISMRVLWIANGLNILLDPLLIFGWGPVPAFGLEGAAIATTIGRGIGVMTQFYFLFRGSKHILVKWSQLKANFSVLLTIISTSLGGVGQMIIAMTSWIFIMRILADIGNEAVAGATIAIRIFMFTTMPAWGMSNAAATLVGQNLGAGEASRAESSVWKIGSYNMIYLMLISVGLYTFHNDLIALFTDDAKVIKIGSTWLRIISYSYFVYGWWMVAVQAFNGSGDTRTPTYINLVFFWIIQIPLAYLFALEWNYGYHGVFWAIFVSETGVGLFTIWLFSKGKWKKETV